MRARSKTTKTDIVAMLETCPCEARLNETSFRRGDDGEIDADYAGESRIRWDDQTPVTRNGGRVFLTDDGAEIAEADVELYEPATN